MATEKVEVYVLDVRVPKEDARRVRVQGELSLGSDSGCDIRIRDFGLAPLQGRFRLQNNVLTFTQLGPDDSLKVGSQKCGHGRMYILDKGDKCVIDKVKLIVRKEKIEVEMENTTNFDLLKDKDEKSEAGVEEAEEVSRDEGTEEHTAPNTESGLVYKEETQEESEEDDEYEYVEEVVYVDEDGNEVKPEKKPGFFSKLFKKKPKPAPTKNLPNRRIGAPNFKKGKKLRQPIAGPLYRLIGLAFNLGFFLAIYHKGLPLLKESAGVDAFKYADEAIAFAKPYLKKLPKKLPEEVASLPYVTDAYKFVLEWLNEPIFYYYLLSFIAYEILFQLILGIGLGQFCVGVYNSGNVILSRFFAPIRVVLSVLLFPFLIFDLPVITSRRSFKEVLTFSNYSKKSAGRTFTLAFIFFPLLALLGANYQLYPIFLDDSAKLTVSERDIKAPRTKIKEEKVKLQSLAFNSKGKTVIKKQLRAIPSLFMKGNLVRPKIVAANYKKATFSDIVRKPSFIKSNEILEVVKNDPLLSFFSPDLALAIKDLKSKKKTPLNSKEIMKVMYHSLSLNIKNPLPALMAVGPILGPYYELKNLIFSKVNAKRITLVELIRGPKEDMIHLGNSDRLASSYVIRLNKDSFDVIEFSYSQEAQATNKRFMEGVFFVTEPFSRPYKKHMEKVLKQKALAEKAFGVLDIFNQAIRGKKINEKEFDFVLNFYAQLSIDALGSANNDYEQIVIDNFAALDKGLLRIYKKSKDTMIRDLRVNLINVQEALSKRDRKTLELNSK